MGYFRHGMGWHYTTEPNSGLDLEGEEETD